MRRRIRLTGRRQLARTVVDVNVIGVGERKEKKLITLAIVKNNVLARLPKTAQVKLRLFENKLAETLDFGTLGDLKPYVDITSRSFSAPSCQLRIVATEEKVKGLLLGSTDTWTLRMEEEKENVDREGILLFQPNDISPRSWKLDLREDDYPIVYIDENIPSSNNWARSDPTFTSCVLPAIIREVFEDIFSNNAPPEREWQEDWIQWAEDLMPGREPPWTDGRTHQREWLDDLLDTFCRRHNLATNLLQDLTKESEIE